MKGYIGSANIDTNSRLCMASSVAGHKRAFGSDTVPGNYADLELADLVVLTGSNLAWCHPVLWQRILAAKERRGSKIVVIDPRETATSDYADLHLAIKPGADVALFNGLLNYLAVDGALKPAYITAHTSGFDDAMHAADVLSSRQIAEIAGIDESKLLSFYRLFAENESAVTVYSQGVNQSTSGTDKVNAIINCHLATGRIGKPGMGPFSVTGQPNAMGGREVGGLANMLACHMDIGNAEHRRTVQTFWNSPAIATKPGLKAVDLFEAMHEGRIKAVWIMGTNPVVSMPDADFASQALQRCDFVAVSDVFENADTLAFANVALPSLAWGEKDGTVTNSERRISRQRAFLRAPGEARADWLQICEVAQRMGFSEGFTYNCAAEIFGEYAGLSGYGNGGTRDFDISALEAISTAHYNELEPFQWPRRGGFDIGESRFFSDGRFFTPDGKARFIPVSHSAPAERPSSCAPMVLNTGRMRDQWHTMTRTSRSARLMSQMAEPVADIHPADALEAGLGAADIASIANERGQVLVRVRITTRQQRGQIFAPMHWTGALSSAGRINAASSRHTDPHSGQPELKHSAVSLSRYPASWYGYSVTRHQPSLQTGYWASSRLSHGWQSEMADVSEPANWTEHAAALLAGSDAMELLAYHDIAARQYRFAAFEGDTLAGLLFVAAQPVAVMRNWAAKQLDGVFSGADDRLRLLAGRAGSALEDPGSPVCTCFEVGANAISRAVLNDGCTTVSSIGSLLGAGTNCGSCRSEIQRIIDAKRTKKAG